MNAREEILGRIRTIPRPASGPVPRTYRRHGQLTAAERVELFSTRVSDYRAAVRRIPASKIADAIGELDGRLGVPAGFPLGWRPRASELVEDHGLPPAELDRLDGVVTGCTVAIAETGTIVLAAGPTEGRRALSLVPDLHVCVVGEEQIVELVPEAVAILRHVLPRPITFISGPSATSDIELSRVEGVHGPRNLIVLVAMRES